MTETTPLLLKANLKQLKLPTMLAEHEKLAREAAKVFANPTNGNAGTLGPTCRAFPKRVAEPWRPREEDSAETDAANDALVHTLVARPDSGIVHRRFGQYVCRMPGKGPRQIYSQYRS